MPTLRSHPRHAPLRGFEPPDECLELLAENADELVDRLCLDRPRRAARRASEAARSRPEPRRAAAPWLLGSGLAVILFGGAFAIRSPAGAGGRAASPAPTPAAATRTALPSLEARPEPAPAWVPVPAASAEGGVADPPSPDPAGGEYYTVKPGDTLSRIAESRYGDRMRYRQIFEANASKLSDPDTLLPGEVVLLPAAGGCDVPVHGWPGPDAAACGNPVGPPDAASR